MAVSFIRVGSYKKKLKDFHKRERSLKERIHTCYQHVCLMFVLSRQATNPSLRKRFSLDDDDYKAAFKIIASTIEEKLIKPYDPENLSRRQARYVPFWA